LLTLRLEVSMAIDDVYSSGYSGGLPAQNVPRPFNPFLLLQSSADVSSVSSDQRAAARRATVTRIRLVHRVGADSGTNAASAQQKDRVQKRLEKMINMEYNDYCISPEDARQISQDFVDVLNDKQAEGMDDALSNFNTTRSPDFDNEVSKLKEKARETATAKRPGAKELWEKYGDRRALRKKVQAKKKAAAEKMAAAEHQIEVLENDIEYLRGLPADPDGVKQQKRLNDIKEKETKVEGWKKAIQTFVEEQPNNIGVKLLSLEREIEAIHRSGKSKDRAEDLERMLDEMRGLLKK
jgi:hypothetical protein